MTRGLARSPDDGDLLLRRARLHRDRGNASAAIFDYVQVLERAGNEPTLLRELTEIYHAQNDYAAAFKTIARHPDLAHDRELRLYRLELLFELNRYAEAVTELTALLGADPKSVDLLLRRSGAQIKLGRYTEAANDLEIVMAAAPKNAQAYALRAAVRRAAKDEAAALADCNRALELDPDQSDALLTRSFIYSGKRQYEESFQDLERLLAATPDHVDGLVARGALRQDTGRLQAALDDYTRALRIKPELLVARRLKASALAVLGENAAAEKEYSSVLATAPRDYLSLTGRAQVRLSLVNREADVLADLEQAIAIQPRATTAFVLRADLHRRAARHEKALADLGRAIDLEPAAAAHAMMRGKLLFELRKFEDAEVDFERVFRQFPNDGAVVRYYARTLKEVGRYEEAVKQYDRLLDAWPEDLDYLCESAELLATVDVREVRNPERAVELATRAVELSKRQAWRPLAASSLAFAAAKNFDRAYADHLLARKLAPEDEQDKLIEQGVAFGRQQPIVAVKPLRRLIQEIRHADPQVSQAAIDAIGKRGEAAAPAVPALTAVLSDREFQFVHTAAYSLGRIGPSAAPALTALKLRTTDPVGAVRLFSAWAVAKIDPDEKESIFVLVDQLRTDELTDLTVQLLSDLGPRAKPATTLLIKLSQSADVDAAQGAIIALGSLGAEGADAAESLLGQLPHERESVRFVAARALLRIGKHADRAHAALRPILASKEVALRIETARLCGSDTALARACLKELIPVLADEYHDIRAAAAEALGKLGPAAAEAIPALAEAVDQPVRIEGRTASVDALAKIGPRSVPTFGKLLHSKDGVTRLLAAGILGQLGTDAAPLAGDLAKLAADESQPLGVRKAALATLGRIGPAAESEVAVIRDLLFSPDEEVGLFAAITLGKIGLHDEAEWQKLLLHEDRKIANRASMALRKMGASGLPPLLKIMANSEVSDDIRSWAAARSIDFEGKPMEEMLEVSATGDDKTAEFVAAALTLVQRDAGTDVLPSLLNALQDSRRPVRRAAARTMIRMTLPLDKVLPSLLDLIQDDDEELRAYANILFQNLGEPAIAPLRAIQQSTPNDVVREAAGHALAAIYRQHQQNKVEGRYQE